MAFDPDENSITAKHRDDYDPPTDRELRRQLTDTEAERDEARADASRAEASLEDTAKLVLKEMALHKETVAERNRLRAELETATAELVRRDLVLSRLREALERMTCGHCNDTGNFCVVDCPVAIARIALRLHPGEDSPRCGRCGHEQARHGGMHGPALGATNRDNASRCAACDGLALYCERYTPSYGPPPEPPEAMNAQEPTCNACGEPESKVDSMDAGGVCMYCRAAERGCAPLEVPAPTEATPPRRPQVDDVVEVSSGRNAWLGNVWVGGVVEYTSDSDPPWVKVRGRDAYFEPSAPGGTSGWRWPKAEPPAPGAVSTFAWAECPTCGKPMHAGPLAQLGACCDCRLSGGDAGKGEPRG